jgi:ribosomal protein S6--L-glutamate ligase
LFNNKKVAVVGIPGKWSTEVIADRLETMTGFRLVVDMADIALDLVNSRVMCGDVDMTTLDGVVVKKISEIYAPSAEDRIRMLTFLESHGVRVFSSTNSMMQMMNRMSGTLALQRLSVPMPPTVITESIEQALATIHQFGSVVIKPLYSTKARGMMLLESSSTEIELRAELNDYLDKNGIFYIQKKLELDGYDLGMVFIGGEYSCTYARVGSKDSWNTTILGGGKYQLYEPTPDLIELGRLAQSSVNLDFTTVDIALTDAGPVVFEVSAFGGFKGALEGCGVDAAEAYAQHVIRKLGEKA